MVARGRDSLPPSSLYPDERLSVAVLSNRAGMCASYARKGFIAVFYLPFLALSRPHKAIKLDPATLSSYAGHYHLEDRFTINVRVAGDRLETMWLGEKIILVRS